MKLKFKDLSKKCGGLSRSTIFRYMRDKGFPRPVYAGGTPLWDSGEVDRWLENLSTAPVRVVAPGARRGRKPKKPAGMDHGHAA